MVSVGVVAVILCTLLGVVVSMVVGVTDPGTCGGDEADRGRTEVVSVSVEEGMLATVLDVWRRWEGRRK